MLQQKCNAWKEDCAGLEVDYREDCSEVDGKRVGIESLK
jgi:hypothetical protein